MTTADDQPNYFDSELADLDHDSLMAAHGITVHDLIDAETHAAIARLMTQRVDEDQS